ncbi:hypothetical protein C8T65DRAFT_667760 [Cerioporus squamosus]|nr:hypothetical protein C8T65DRAFT_667760 [Cerioporus squamosus]
MHIVLTEVGRDGRRIARRAHSRPQASAPWAPVGQHCRMVGPIHSCCAQKTSRAPPTSSWRLSPRLRAVLPLVLSSKYALSTPVPHT